MIPEENSFSFVAAWLEAHGWRRDIAGPTDFDAAVRAIVAMRGTSRHGLYVTGHYGCGKTALLRTLTQGRGFWVRLSDSESIQRLSPDWQRLCAADPFAGNVVLDDLGAENIRNDYGVKIDTVGDFILCYHAFGQGRLFISTNLTAEELDARYGGRIRSRLRELCVPLKLSGGDKRAWVLPQHDKPTAAAT